MKRNNPVRRLSAGLLAAVMLAGVCPLHSAADETVYIGSPEELQSLARQCTSDRYSAQLTVVLTRDIDLQETELSVPVFLGTFDGGGHRITGLKITSENSRAALFGRLEKGAVVRNLQVEGTVSPAGSQNRVAGLAGENYGTVENCRFSGFVSGAGQVGGIAGLNEAGSTVTGCSVSGVIRGRQLTGGIVGENAGSILRCSNEAAVNTTVTEEELTAAELAEADSVLYDLLKQRERDYEIPVTTDTGGIAGHSTGVIQSCENGGTVGYRHVGYNVGGIVGRQSGYLSNCCNRGRVLGRKDVGGIVGQMVPDITLRASAGGLEELQTELNTLQSMIDRTLNDADEASQTVSGRLNQVSGYTETARGSAHDMTGQLSSFADANIEAVNGLSLLIERYISKWVPIAEDLAAASEGMTDTIREARRLLEVLDGTTAYNEQFLLEFREFCTETAQAAADMSAGLEALDRAFALLESGPELPDTAQLKTDVEALLAASSALEATVSRALEELRSSGTVTEETARALAEKLQTVLDCRMAVNRDLKELLENTDLLGLIRQDLEKLRQFAAEMRTAIGSFSSASAHFGKAMEALGRGVDVLRNLNTKLSEAAAQLDTVLEAAQSTAESLQSALRKAAQWVEDLSQEEPITFTPLGSEFADSSESLNAALGGIQHELSALNDDLSDSGAVLLADLRAVNAQFMKVMNLFLNLIHETQNVEYTDLFEDASEDSLQSAVQGKVQESENSGPVEADRNVGGVVGAMAIEYDFDPEDDLLPDDRSNRFTYQTRAVLLNCKNSGSVTAKRSCAGSVVGRMDIGTVYGCGGFGDTASDSGDYVGGVCGFSVSSVKHSFAKCTLSGRSYVGGIVGSGKRVEGCASMIVIASDSAFRGAVAGEITGDYSGNVFVSETLAGVDRISYAGKAEPIAYAGLLELEGLPDEMRRFTLRFVADGVELKALTFRYGDSFAPETAPELPPKEGYYGVWSLTDWNGLHFDTTVVAEYIPYVTAVAGEVRRADGRSVFLVEGKFNREAVLTATPCSIAEREFPVLPRWQSRELIEGWTLTLPDDGQDSHKVHYLLPEGRKDGIRLWVRKNGVWEAAETGEFGSYLTAELGGTVTDIAVTRERPLWWVWCLPAGGLLLIVGCCAAIGAAHAKRKKRAAAQRREQAAGGESPSGGEGSGNA